MTPTSTLTPAIQTAPLPVTQEQAAAWVGLAKEKNRIAFELNNAELNAQSIILKVQQNCEFYGPIDAGLAEYRKAHASMVELRKQFTGVIDSAIVQPLMEFEKRVDPKNNGNYNALLNRSLVLRKAEADKAALTNAKNQEIANFKAHIVNEFSRVVTEYRQMIRREFTNHYELCLKDKVADPSLEKVKALLKQIMPPSVSKFAARYLGSEELLAIYNESKKPDYEEYYDDLMKEADELFANYSSDLANAEAAIAHQKQQAALKEQEDVKKAHEEQALNTLIATSETVVIEEPKIKRTVQVTIIESEAWAKAVMAAFIVNMPHLGKYIRVKKWSNLNVGQMATCLGQYATETGEKFNGLELTEVEK